MTNRGATLVDDLHDRGYRYPFVLDVSASALDVARARPRDHAGAVDWQCSSVTAYPLMHHRHDVWHDRAASATCMRPTTASFGEYAFAHTPS